MRIPGEFKPPDTGYWGVSRNGISARMLDVDRHLTAKDVPGPLIVIGSILLVVAIIGILLLKVRFETVQNAVNLYLFYALAVVGFTFYAAGVAFWLTVRRKRYLSRDGTDTESSSSHHDLHQHSHHHHHPHHDSTAE
jgi:hypothetical protein